MSAAKSVRPTADGLDDPGADVALFSNLYSQVLFGRLSPSGVDRVWLLLLQSMVVFNHG